MQTITLTLPRLHTAQSNVVQNATRFNVLACGRRWGKTVLGQDRCAEPAVLPYPVAWFTPSYKMMIEVWRELTHTFKPITARQSTQERRLEFITGGVLEFWSLDNPDAARGRKYKRAIIDEAAMVPGLGDAWQMVIRPTLADYQGSAYFLSTPKGYNDFKKLYDFGIDPTMTDWSSWQMPTHENPYIVPDEIESMREEMPEATYNQEVLAVFNENEGAVFRNIAANLTAPETTPKKHDGHQIVMGVDWGKHNDYTVFSVGCVTCRRELDLYRSNKLDYEVQRQMLEHYYDKWSVSSILPESNAMGEPIIEQLVRAGLPIHFENDKAGFWTSPSTKPPLIENMKLSLEREEFEFLDIPYATGELEAYEQKTSRFTGRTQYSAPEGLHDDTVMARALMLWLSQSSWW